MLCLPLSACSGDTRSVPDAGCDVTAFVPQTIPGGETEVMVPMRDCVRLATDIHLPEGPGPFPTILIRLPYDKEMGTEGFSLMQVAAFTFTRNGYATVIQDTRGRFDSEGEWIPFLHEQEDGLDTVRWVEAQPWFDGNLGLFGGSYFAFTGMAIAHQKPACLRTMVSLIISGDIHSWLFTSGLPRGDIAVNWALGSSRTDTLEKLPEELFQQAALHWPLSRGDDVTVGNLPWFDEWLAHPFDDGFYQRYLPADVYQRIQVPTLMLSGWFDIFLTGQLADFRTALAREARPGDNRIIIGPWTHVMGVGEDHDYRFQQPKSLVDFIPHLVNWYDHWIKGKPAREWGPVHAYDPGTGTWADRNDLWAPDRADSVFFLQGDPGAAACQPAGELTREAPSVPASLQYTYDPLDPVIRYGGPLLNMDSGCLLENDNCGRPDVLTFLSAPLDRDLPLEGEIFLEVTVSSSAPDTAFIGRLALVKPDGRAYFLRQGIATLSHRDGDLQQAPYEPGEVVDLRIEMPLLLWTLREGERLRLEISSSSFPSVVQHPNVDRDWFQVTDPLPAGQTVHLSPERPARLVFRVALP
jgi:putative CocE/NonD family hydrolase